MTRRPLFHTLLGASALLCAPLAPADHHGGGDGEKKEASKNPTVEMKTSMGDITIELFLEKSPITVENFLKYVTKKHYDGTVFHRVIDGFMIQGGGFAKGDVPEQKETLDPIINEAKLSGLKNDTGTIAMARTNDPDSATNQFFINVVDNDNLNPGGFSPDGYAVFGKVTAGMDVVNKIKSVETGTSTLKSRAGGRLIDNPSQDVPVEQVVIESVRVKAG